ncbi:beta-D-glucosyl crocetin beta-1,6-glucosyltransferase [Quercus suber]|uniref:beta-D-glucosyl crocetin beta-1,6-glucosyltransferase n=1 Tax=Quercus suber TaxID=58331 RepID=UPI0032DE92BD
MEATHNTISVLMLPWLAHGHISPFLELAKKLTTRNIHIYFCTTPINLGPIKQQLSKKYSLSIEFVELHLPSLPELPPHYHTTNGLPPHLMPALKKAMDMASPNITSILKQLKPDLVIYDFLQILTPSLAQSQNIPAVEFVVMSATMTSFFMHLANNPGVEYPSPEIYLQDYEVGKFTDDSDDGDRILECFHQSSEIVLVKTFREIEAKYIDYLSVLAKKKIVPVGPLVQDPVEEDEKKEIIEWLNDKEPSSAVFVSFGSEFFLSKEEMQEIAYGLELSMVPFIWVVRFPRGEKVNLQMALPKGFLDRIGDRGMVVEGWAPQKTILKHSSIGGFVSHCGWSSVMESMTFGVPIIAMPMHLDQPVNARLVAALGAGVEVKRDTNGRLEREEVAKVIRKVLVEKTPKRKAKELKENIENKGDEEIDVVVQDLLRLCSKSKE